MKNISLGSLLASLFLFIQIQGFANTDSSILYKANYTNKEWKKESKDIKQFAKIIKEYKKSMGSNNIDLKNATLNLLKEQMKKEADELNNRITARAKKFSPAKKNTDTLITSDLPVGYNPTIKGQIKRVDKNSILEGKSETEILLKYSRILNKENKVIRQISLMKEITEITPEVSYNEILNNANEFKTYLKDELNLMAKEKGKK
ncbi:MAG: hypothetical protein ABIO44_01220 [Saprospiraceae bacterium]